MTAKLIRWDELKEMLPNVGRTTVRRWEKVSDFPPAIELGPNTIAWDQDKVKEWLNKKLKSDV